MMGDVKVNRHEGAVAVKSSHAKEDFLRTWRDVAGPEEW